ncbi:MAG: site-2 protease family protein [Candidatus Hydrogenedentes bacterium]|nr:site-2 protease family protein [Candidatus Hydrogenedentota bacterium]
MTTPEFELLTPLVSRVFSIDDITLGDTQRGFLARYRGALRLDSALAYDQLAESLKPHRIMPVFLKEDERQVIVLIPEAPAPKIANPWTNLGVFLITLISVLFTGAIFESVLPEAASFDVVVKDAFIHMWRGWPFAASLLAILLAHEFGHYLTGRYHKTHVSLPYFLPLPYPLSFLGTLGAFIQMKERPKNKRILFDIGIAGPLAGLVVAIPIVLLGLSLSEVTRLTGGGVLEGNSLLYLFSKFIVFGRWLPEPVSYGGLSPLLYWTRYIFTGMPIPLGGFDVQVHPVAWAGWAGLLVTALNLIPAGTLDGGHILYAVLGERARKFFPYIVTVLLALGLAWEGWWLWAAMLFVLGRVHAEPLDQITELDPRRRALAVLMLVIFILVFTPVPLIAYG